MQGNGWSRGGQMCWNVAALEAAVVVAKRLHIHISGTFISFVGNGLIASYCRTYNAIVELRFERENKFFFAQQSHFTQRQAASSHISMNHFFSFAFVIQHTVNVEFRVWYPWHKQLFPDSLQTRLPTPVRIYKKSILQGKSQKVKREVNGRTLKMCPQMCIDRWITVETFGWKIHKEENSLCAISSPRKRDLFSMMK